MDKIKVDFLTQQLSLKNKIKATSTNTSIRMFRIKFIDAWMSG